jgi:hypothetical protein
MVKVVGPLAPGRRSIEDVEIDSIRTMVSARKVVKAEKSHSAKFGRPSNGINGGLRDRKNCRLVVESHSHNRRREK